MVRRQEDKKQSEVVKTSTLYFLLHLILEVVPHGEPHELLHQLFPRTCCMPALLLVFVFTADVKLENMLKIKHFYLFIIWD